MAINANVPSPEEKLLMERTDEDEKELLEKGDGDVSFLKKENPASQPPNDEGEFLQDDSFAEGIVFMIEAGAKIGTPWAVNKYRRYTGQKGEAPATAAAKVATMDKKTETRIKGLTQKTLDYYLTETKNPLVALIMVVFFYLLTVVFAVNELADNEALKTEIKEKDKKIKDLETEIENVKKAKIKKFKEETKEDEKEQKTEERDEEKIVFEEPEKPKRGRPRKEKV